MNTIENYISVCVPTFNGQRYIGKCIDSILAQRYDNYEIVVVDDCSNDSTFEIVKDYALKQKKIRFRYFRNNHNLGLVSNWNQCIKYAKGDWIKFVFQDDIITQDCLEKFIEATKLNIPIICCGRDFIFEIDTPSYLVKQYKKRFFLKEIFPGKSFISPNELNETILKYPGENFIGEPTTLMIHKNVFSRFGVFSPDLVHFCDFEYWLRVACHTGIVVVPEVLAYFRVHNQSASAYNHKKFYRSFRIDHSILFYNLAFNISYLPLQKYAMINYYGNPVTTLLSIKTRRARLDAHQSNDKEIINDWNMLIDRYPEVEKLSHRSFLFLIIEYLFFKIQSILKSLMSQRK